MYLRISRVRHGAKTYEYAQLVESYRREKDGMPTVRVVASLGQLSGAQLANWRVALDAMREGKTLVAAERQPGKRPVKPHANLGYLDLAVLLELWNGWGLTRLLDELMPSADALVRPSLVVAGLSLQRCVEPTPKAYAPEWFAKTALPELLGVTPAHYNNTRLHRVLEDLHEVTPELCTRLPRLYAEQDGRFVAMFADVTDTWFVGHGPDIAQKGKTKEGRFERKINIVLLCNEHGYPLRWKVLPGRQADCKALLEMYRSLSGLSWVGTTPVVCDRAMGHTIHLRGLLETGVRFLTAMTRTEFGSYAKTIPFLPLLDFEPTPGPEPAEKDIVRVRQQIETTETKKVADDLYILDFGVIEPADDGRNNETSSEEQSTQAGSVVDKTANAMELGRRLQADLDEGRAASYREAGILHRIDKGLVARYLRLLRLPPDVQDAILRGEAVGLSVKSLAVVAALPDGAQQRTEFARLVQQAAQRPDGRRTRTTTKRDRSPAQPPEPLRVRAVLYFNPEIFVRQRWAAAQALAALQATIAEINRSLASPLARMDDRTVTGEVYTALRKHSLLDIFEFAIVEHQSEATGGRTCRQVELTFKKRAWTLQRRYDGFSLVVGHPEIQGSAGELVQLYRSKQAVEHDFHVIKSLVDLRPLHHRVNEKVDAHVTLCMLGLLLERTLSRKLAAVRSSFTSRSALQALESCHLNMYGAEPGRLAAYCITHLNEPQAAILRALRFKHLADDREMTDRMTPR